MRYTMIATLTCLITFAATASRADCICRFKGGTVTHGQTACVATPHGKELARCEKVLNMASWHFLGQPCPLAAGEDLKMSLPASHS